MITSRLRKVDEIIYYDIWRDYSATSFKDGSWLELFNKDLADHALSREEIKNYIWIFDLKPEGIGSQDIEGMYHYMRDAGLPARNFRVIFSCVEDVGKLPYVARCLPDRLIYNGNWYMHLKHYRINWKEMPMEYKLVCLMRRPSISRGNLAKRLLAKFPLKDIVMTFGTNGVEPSDDIKRLIWPRPYPMIVDRPMADQVFQHRIDHDFFYRAPVNLIVESSSQIDPGTWTSIFITEKTFKAMAWYQFPIWYAVPGLVAEVRKLGFDLFDDLFDNHGYDDIRDPWVRMTTVVQQVWRFCQQDLLDLRSKFWNRLEANAKLVDQIFETAIVRHTETINEIKNA